MASHSNGSTSNGRFDSTNWSLIVAARGGNLPEARRALADLCEAYWYPLYAYIRRRGHAPDRAQDLTQEFFARLLGRDFLNHVDPTKGRFRSFLLASCQNFLANQGDHDRARKRGGGCLTISIEPADAEGRYACEPAHELTPDRLFERRWALTLLERVLDQLADEMERSGKKCLFDRLGPALLGDGRLAPYAQVGAELGMTEAAVKMAAHRLRRRYSELVRAEVMRTVGGAGDVEDEIRDLFDALR